MINGGLIAAKIEFKAWNHHEGGWNPSLSDVILFAKIANCKALQTVFQTISVINILVINSVVTMLDINANDGDLIDLFRVCWQRDVTFKSSIL